MSRKLENDEKYQSNCKFYFFFFIYKNSYLLWYLNFKMYLFKYRSLALHLPLK